MCSILPMDRLIPKSKPLCTQIESVRVLSKSIERVFVHRAEILSNLFVLYSYQWATKSLRRESSMEPYFCPAIVRLSSLFGGD